LCRGRGGILKNDKKRREREVESGNGEMKVSGEECEWLPLTSWIGTLQLLGFRYKWAQKNLENWVLKDLYKLHSC